MHFRPEQDRIREGPVNRPLVVVDFHDRFVLLVERVQDFGLSRDVHRAYCIAVVSQL